VKTTAVMLADYATVREGLLNVLGAGITKLFRDPLPAPMGVVVAILLQPMDNADLMTPHNLEVIITHVGNDEESAVAKAVMTMNAGTVATGPLPTLPVVVPLQSVPITATGVHQITVKLDGEAAETIEFEVLKTASLEAESD
jgi:hypothetical protein